MREEEQQAWHTAAAQRVCVGWLDGWMMTDGQVDGWMDDDRGTGGWMDGWTDGYPNLREYNR